ATVLSERVEDEHLGLRPEPACPKNDEGGGERLSRPGRTEDPPRVARVRPAVEEDGTGVGEGQADQYPGRFEQGLVHEREQCREPVRGQSLPVPGGTRLGREELRRLERPFRLVPRNSGPEAQRGEPLRETEPLSLGP